MDSLNFAGSDSFWADFKMSPDDFKIWTGEKNAIKDSAQLLGYYER